MQKPYDCWHWMQKTRKQNLAYDVCPMWGSEAPCKVLASHLQKIHDICTIGIICTIYAAALIQTIYLHDKRVRQPICQMPIDYGLIEGKLLAMISPALHCNLIAFILPGFRKF